MFVYPVVCISLNPICRGNGASDPSPSRIPMAPVELATAFEAEGDVYDLKEPSFIPIVPTAPEACIPLPPPPTQMLQPINPMMNLHLDIVGEGTAILGGGDAYGQ